MTCIVGLVQGGHVYIGGDSAGVGGLDLTVRSDEKVFRNGECLFGFTTSFRMGQILRYSLSIPSRREEQDDFKYLATTFIDAVRSALKDGGFAQKKDDAEQGGNFLLGYRGNLYQVYSDYQVAKSVDGFEACGCGYQIANGSLYSTKGRKPRERILLALRAAERFSAGVRGPFKVLELPR